MVNANRANEAGRTHGETLPGRYASVVKESFVASAHEHFAIETRPNVILSDCEVRQIIYSAGLVDLKDEWDGDLARLVICLAATGARFSQIARCKISDLQPANRRLMVPVSRKGRGKKAVMHTAVPIGDDVIAALRPAIEERRGHEVLLQRWGYKRTGTRAWKRDHRREWLPSEISPPFREIVKLTKFSSDVSAYALRHSSIVRGLKLGLPVRFVAALHDTSTEMIERHYSAHIVDALTDVARLAIVPLVNTLTNARLMTTSA